MKHDLHQGRHILYFYIKIGGFGFPAHRDRLHNRWGGVIIYTNEDQPCEKQKMYDMIKLKQYGSNCLSQMLSLYLCTQSTVLLMHQQSSIYFSQMFDHTHAQDKEIIMMRKTNLDFINPEEIHNHQNNEHISFAVQ